MTARRASFRLLGAALVAVSVLGCSAVDDVSACADVAAAITGGLDSVESAASDPASAVASLRAFAEDIRSAVDGADPQIADAASELATAFEAMASGIEGGQTPDLATLQAAAAPLLEACA